MLALPYEQVHYQAQCVRHLLAKTLTSLCNSEEYSIPEHWLYHCRVHVVLCRAEVSASESRVLEHSAAVIEVPM
jgi:hypothetical protein